MPKLKLSSYTPPQTLVFVPGNGALISPSTVNEGTVTFWRDTPRESLDIVASLVDNGIVTNTQEQGNGEYFISIEGVEATNGNPFAPLTQRFGIEGGHYVFPPEAEKE